MRATVSAFSLTFLLASWPAHIATAAPPSATDRASIEVVISAQLDAFHRDDAGQAFSYASPHIQAIFHDPDTFLTMVRQGYPTVYRSQSASFGTLDASGQEPVQKVELVGPDGEGALALYDMQREPDGNWRIDGCVLVKSERIET